MALVLFDIAGWHWQIYIDKYFFLCDNLTYKGSSVALFAVRRFNECELFHNYSFFLNKFGQRISVQKKRPQSTHKEGKWVSKMVNKFRILAWFYLLACNGFKASNYIILVIFPVDR